MIFLILIFTGTVLIGSAQGWEELKGEHFIVYFNQNENFARDVLNKAEGYYRRIASDLGYARVSDFWTWDKRVKIYIFSDHASFLKGTNQPEWSQGMADYTNKRIISYNWSKGFLESLLPHEIAHLIFRDFVGFKGEVPLWLDEGVAQWEELPKRGLVKATARQYFLGHKFFSLQELMSLDQEGLRQLIQRQETLKSENQTQDKFAYSDDLIRIYYVQSASLVGFLIDRYGADSFANFSRQLRDGKNLNEALSFSYTASVADVNELEKRWIEYLGD